MTVRPATVALLSMLWIVPAPAQAHAAQDAAPDTPAGASVLQVQDAPNQIITVHTRIRHTTVIQLPAHENILDFVVGDSEYWHLTGAANLAFLKPIGEGVNTNVAGIFHRSPVDRGVFRRLNISPLPRPIYRLNISPLHI